MKKTGRNDPCPCGSGKKFKKCCESKMLGGRFMASKIQDTTVALPKKVASLTGLFQTKVSQISQPSDTTRSLAPTSPPQENSSAEEKSSESPKIEDQETNSKNQNKEIES